MVCLALNFALFRLDKNTGIFLPYLVLCFTGNNLTTLAEISKPSKCLKMRNEVKTNLVSKFKPKHVTFYFIALT